MLTDRRISLDPRLSAIADMLGACDCCADIGSDHGRLGAFMLQTGQCRKVYFTDISAPSLEKARRLIRLLGLEGRAAFCVGDGAGALEGAVDAAVIAGMGGETIAHIVENSGGKFADARLILQPNVAISQLRRRLSDGDWAIEDERLVRDGRRIYVLIAARRGNQRLDELQCAVGPVLMARRPALLQDYAQFRIRVACKALQGAERGSDAENVRALQRELEIWKVVETWQ